MMQLFDTIFQNFGSEIFRICFISIGALFAIALTDLIFRKFITPYSPTRRAKTLTLVLANGVKVVIFSVAAIVSLSALHVNVMPLLASAGIVGLAVAFGSNVLIKDIITGMFFIFENQFNAGDVVKIDNIQGVVESVGLRTISIRDRDTGALHIIPNGSITRLANLTSSYSCTVVTIPVSVNNDASAVYDALVKTAQEMSEKDEYKNYMTEEIKVYALDSIADGKMSYKIVIKTSPNKQEAVAQHYRFLAKTNLDKAKVAFA